VLPDLCALRAAWLRAWANGHDGIVGERPIQIGIAQQLVENLVTGKRPLMAGARLWRAARIIGERESALLRESDQCAIQRPDWMSNSALRGGDISAERA